MAEWRPGRGDKIQSIPAIYWRMFGKKPIVWWTQPFSLIGECGGLWQLECQPATEKAKWVVSYGLSPKAVVFTGVKWLSLQKGWLRAEKWLSIHLAHKKEEKKEKGFWTGHQLLSFHCLCDCGYTAVSQHLADVLKRVRSSLGLNDNRNHPNSEGDYLSGDLLQSGKFSFRTFFFLRWLIFPINWAFPLPPIHCWRLNAMKLKAVKLNLLCELWKWGAEMRLEVPLM